MIDLTDHIPGVLRRPVRVLLAAKSGFICFASLIMAFTFLCVVILRYGFDADLFAYEEWLLVICFWLYFMGSALGTYEDSHVNADLLNYLTDNQRLIWLRTVLVCVIELIVSAAVVYWAVLMLQDEFSAYPNWQSTIALKIPFVVPRFGVLVGFGFMTFYSGLRLYVLLKLGTVIPRRRAGATGDDERPTDAGA